MRILKPALVCGIAMLCLAGPRGLMARDQQAEAAARKAMDDYMKAFNSRNVEAWSATLNYPHVTFAGNRVQVFDTGDDFKRANADYPSRLAPWDHSSWVSMRVIQSGPDKVHIAVVFARFAKGRETGRYPALYIVTRASIGGTWGVQARSSFAP